MIVKARFHDYFHKLINFSCQQLKEPHLFVNLNSCNEKIFCRMQLIQLRADQSALS